MSLIPFILDLADELHEFSRCLANGIDINDFGFGLYTGADQHLPTQNQSQQQQNQQQQQQQQQQPQQQPQTSPRRNRTSSFSSFWLPSKRHHPYNRIKTACCAKSGEDVGVTTPEKSDATTSIGGTPGKSASYSVVNKNGFQVSMNVKQFAPNELSVKTIDNCIVVEGRHDDKEDGHGVISRHFVRKYMLPKGYDPNDVLSTLSSDGILTVKAPPPPPPAAAKNDESNERIIEIQPTPGPTPVLVVSAKDTSTKETTKKLAATNTTTTSSSSSSSTRLECQLPEKRQKLDLPPESEESAITPAPTNNESETTLPASKAANVETVELSNDVEMEKAIEKVEEIVEKQSLVMPATDEIELEKKIEIIEQAEKQKDKEQEIRKDETEKVAAKELCLNSSNGDDKNVEEKMEESVEETEKTETINETPAEIKTKNEENNEKSSVTKMEIDGDEDEGHNTTNDVVNDGDKKTDNTDNIVANVKTADVETETAVKAAAEVTDSAKTVTDSEKTNNTDTSNKNKSTNNTTTTNTNTTTTTTNKSNSSSSTNSTTNNSSNNDNNTENSTEKVIKLGDNGIETGEIPDVVNTNTKEKEADTKISAAVEDSKTVTKESDGKLENETAELNTNTITNTTTTTTTTNTNTNTTSKTKDIIDDVALLKAATADPAVITTTAEENVILTEPMDGITETDDSNTTNTTTNTTAVDNVECSLFAKKSHLGNGNNTTATPVVGTEEMAN